ncbi:MAG: diphosphomevalonate decarboxylase [Thermoprotei archaeon]
MRKAKVEAPSNIAIVKYWGKREASLNLPLNSSFSVTLDALKVVTEVTVEDGPGKDELYINNEPVTGEEFEEYAGRVLKAFRRLYGDFHATIKSVSNFPKSAGLASSAAGIAALVFALNEALGLDLPQRELSKIARIGSGSACRSTAGGFVLWEKGVREDGEDSVCYQVFPETHWPELVDVIGLVGKEKKKVSSRKGMMRVSSSSLTECRLKFVEETLPKVIDAVKRRDEQEFYYWTMRHSNSMHAVILDSWPSTFYLNDVSLALMERVQDSGIAGYTFDAGPNPHVFTTEKHLDEVKEIMKEVGIREVVVSRVGQGPKVLESPR